MGEPVPIVITEDEGAGAVEFLDICLNLVPNDPLIELSDEIKKMPPFYSRKRGFGVGLIEKIDSRGSQAFVFLGVGQIS